MLISSDKAVRPDKCDGCVQAVGRVGGAGSRQTQEFKTVFSMVRFGNVLGSSGSVVPLFQEQLSRGGPLTVTDEGVERYFMTVQEAVQLVLAGQCYQPSGARFLCLIWVNPFRSCHWPVRSSRQQVMLCVTLTIPMAISKSRSLACVRVKRCQKSSPYQASLIGTSLPQSLHGAGGRVVQIEIASALRHLREAFVASDEEMARDVVRRWVEGYQVRRTRSGCLVMQGRRIVTLLRQSLQGVTGFVAHYCSDVH